MGDLAPRGFVVCVSLGAKERGAGSRVEEKTV